MRTNTTKAKLSEGKVVFGAIVNEYSPATVELFGALGFDFVMIDCEHGPMAVDQVENMVRAAEVFGITPIARIPNHDDSTVLRFLDRGVQGVIIPHVNTKAQAEAVSKAARYYPEGHRGAGGGRPQDYGIGVTREEALKWVNSQVLVIPMVEKVEAINNLDEIVTVPGIDVLHVAAGDLSQSMHFPPQAEVRAAMDKAITKIRGAGKSVGIGGNSPSDIDRLVHVIKLGANFITIGAQGLMRIGAEGFKKQIDAALAK